MILEEVIAKCEERVEMLIESMNACDLDDPVEKLLARNDAKGADEHRQIAEWLKELQEKRKADSCDGCCHDVNGYKCASVCSECRRSYGDKYEPERRTDG